VPYVIAFPHNSTSVAGASAVALRYALANRRRALTGEPPLHLLRPDERVH
jgi:hypothetical protein